LQARLDASANVDLHAIDVAVADAFTLIPRAVLTPWDRFIVATAKALELPLVNTRRRHPESNLVETVW
jgi:PIN domain nuclease of toxin-antitoxin system